MAILKLLKNIPLDINYEETIDFDSLSSQYAFFNNQVASGDTFNEVLFVRNDAERVYGIFGNANTKLDVNVKLPISIEVARTYNYCMFQNDNDTKWYYGFIIGTAYVNETVSQFNVFIDVFQTFMFDFTLDNGFIEREHQDRWTKQSQGDPLSAPIYNLEKESFNCGSEYDVKRFKRYATKTFTSGPYKDTMLVWLMIIWKQSPAENNTQLSPTSFGVQDDLTITYSPYLINLTVDRVNYPNASLGLTKYISYNNVTTWLMDGPSMMASVIQRNEYIQGAYIVPYLPSIFTNSYDIGFFKESGDSNVWHLEIISNNTSTTESMYLQPMELNSSDPDFPILPPPVPTPNYYNVLKLVMWGQNIYNFQTKTIVEEIIGSVDKPSVPVVIPTVVAGEVTQDSDIKYESKLDTYPYRVNELQVNNQVKEYRNEYLPSGAYITVKECYYDYPYLQIGIKNYNNDETLNREGLIDRTINDLVLITDAYLEYWIRNKSQVTTGIAMAGAQLGGAVASLPYDVATNSTNINKDVLRTTDIYQHNQTSKNKYYEERQRTRTVDKSITQKDYQGGLGVGSVVATAVNFAGTIANAMAVKEDLLRTPDQIRSLGNNGTIANITMSFIPTVYDLSIKDYYKQKLYNYFRLYGYSSLRFTFYGDGKELNMRSRYYYNYIKCSAVHLRGTINKLYINQLEEILTKGITIWHKRDGMNSFSLHKYNKENWEMNLIEYN